MEVLDVNENDDGSATVEFRLNPSELKAVLERALRIGLLDGLKLSEKQRMKEFNESITNQG